MSLPIRLTVRIVAHWDKPVPGQLISPAFVKFDAEVHGAISSIIPGDHESHEAYVEDCHRQCDRALSEALEVLPQMVADKNPGTGVPTRITVYETGAWEVFTTQGDNPDGLSDDD